MPSVDGEHYSLNRPFEGVRTQNANNVRHPPSGRRMGVNRDFTAWEFWIGCTSRRPFSLKLGVRGAHMGVPTIAESQLQRPSGSGVTTGTGDRTIINRTIINRPKQPRHPPIVLSTPCQMGNFVTASRRESDPFPPARSRGVQRDSLGPRSQNRTRPSG